MTPKRFRVATLNANSIRARLGTVLDWLAAEKPDVLGLQETKVQDEQFPAQAFQEAGYHVVFRGQKAYSGVATVSASEPSTVRFGFGKGEATDEARLIRAEIEGIPIVNTYVPQGREVESPHFEHKLEWLERLRALLERDHSPEEPLLWIGDFNVAPEPRDVYNPERLKNHVDFHPRAREALQKVKEWGFVDVFRKHHPEGGQFSFWDYRARGNLERNRGWRVDHVWATRPLAERSVSSWIDVEARKRDKASDHTFVVADFQL